MSKILNRPMFRGGGTVSSYGNGIATGLADGGRVNLQAGGPPQRTSQNPYKLSDPVYASGYSAYEPNYTSGNLTGADVKRIAEKKVFTSGLGKNTAQLNSTLKDFYNNYIQSPLEKGGNSMIDYVIGSEFNDEDAAVFGNNKDFKRIYDRDVMPEATRLSNELITQENSDDTYEEEFLDKETYFDEKEKLQFRDTNEVDLRNKARLKSYVDNAPSTDREDYRSSQYDDGSLKALLTRQRFAEEEANRIKPGGQDAAESDFEIPEGVTELEGEEEVGEIGFANMAEEYYNMMGAGADERMAERIAATEAREDARIKRARGSDISNTLLKFFEGSQEGGATVGSSAANASKYLTSKESATESARRGKDAKLDRLEDAGFNRDEARRDRAGQMAFKDMMQDKQFNFSDVKSDKDFDRKMKMLEKQLAATSSDVEKRIIAARIGKLEDLKSRQYSPGINQKNVEYLMSLPDGAKKTAALKAAGYANNIFRQATNASLNLEGAGAYTVDDVVAEGGIYFSDWGGVWRNDGSQEDGTYIIPGSKEILKIQGGKEIYRKPIAIV